jgi:hypothetical protein
MISWLPKKVYTYVHTLYSSRDAVTKFTLLITKIGKSRGIVPLKPVKSANYIKLTFPLMTNY